jgi:hypothetical protein
VLGTEGVGAHFEKVVKLSCESKCVGEVSDRFTNPGRCRAVAQEEEEEEEEEGELEVLSCADLRMGDYQVVARFRAP